MEWQMVFMRKCKKHHHIQMRDSRYLVKRVEDGSPGPLRDVCHELGQQDRARAQQEAHGDGGGGAEGGGGQLPPQQPPGRAVEAQEDGEPEVGQPGQARLGVVDSRRLLVHLLLRGAAVGGSLLLQLVTECAKDFIQWISSASIVAFEESVDEL